MLDYIIKKSVYKFETQSKHLINFKKYILRGSIVNMNDQIYYKFLSFGHDLFTAKLLLTKQFEGYILVFLNIFTEICYNGSISYKNGHNHLVLKVEVANHKLINEYNQFQSMSYIINNT